MPLPDGSKVTKLTNGKYTRSLSLTLPAEVEVQGRKAKKTLPLSFSERGSTVYPYRDGQTQVAQGQSNVRVIFFFSFFIS